MEVALLQYDIVWESPEVNFELINKMIEKTEAEVYFLPEMFSTGFSMQPEKIAEPQEGKSFVFLQQCAKAKNAVFTASIPTRLANNSYVNRLYWVLPDGSYDFYDKRHLFTYAGEHLHYTSGKEQKIFEYKNWRWKPQICYDLRFPVWARNTEEYDVVFYLANWPQMRVMAWRVLLQARAIENMCYSIGVNRLGKDKNGIVHNGKSAVYDMLGNLLVPEVKTPNIQTFHLDKEVLQKSRKRFGFLNDRDSFCLEIV